MTHRILLQNAQIPHQPGLHQLLLESGQILTLAPQQSDPLAPNLPTLDLQGDWLTPSGLDLQINGALGLPFPELTPDNLHRLDKIGAYLWEQGIDSYCPTLVTTAIANIHRTLDLLTPHLSPKPHRAQILGVHLEGPCLNPSKRGAHPAEFLQPLTLNSIKQILGDYSSIVKIITLAPELDPTGTVIPYLKSLGITISLGHSQATAAQATQAFAQGATMVTHAFNAMPPLHHREPGLLGAALTTPNIHSGFIADGQHITPTMLKILLQAGDYDRRLFLVSDALSPLGLPDGRYPWDSRQITVTNGTARLDDGTLSGTTLPLLKGVQNLIEWGICTVEQAITLATTAPRQAIGHPTTLTQNLLRWHPTHGTWQRLSL